MKKIKFTTSILLGFLITCFVYYVYKILPISPHSLPVWSDEFMYYINSHAFYETNELAAPLTFSGNGSTLLHSDAHGMMYTLTHGYIAKIFGWQNLNMIYTNLLLIAISAFSFSLVKNLDLQSKLMAMLFVLTYPFTMLFGLTYMQEIFHVFFGVMAGIALYKSFTSSHRNRYIGIYIAIISIAALYRPTWLFWFVGLIPLAKSKTQYILFSLLFFTGIGLSFLYAKYYFEFVPNFFNKALTTLNTKGFGVFISLLYDHFIDNINSYKEIHAQFIYNLLKIAILVITAIFTFLLIRKKEKIFLSVVSILYLNILFLLVIYDAFSWREIRFLTPLFYFSIIFIIKYLKPYIKYAITLFLFISFINAQKELFINNRKQIINPKDLHTENTKLKDVISSFSTTQPLIGLLDFYPSDNSMDLLALPIKSNSNIPIRYIVPYYKVPHVKHNFIIKKNNGKLSAYQINNE